jgi:hypothetical protein
MLEKMKSFNTVGQEMLMIISPNFISGSQTTTPNTEDKN